MSKILIPVDGSPSSARAAEFVARLARASADVEVHVVNVQAMGDDWKVRRLYDSEELVRMEREWAESALQPARDVLTAAGVAIREHFERGDVAKTIVALAESLGCDQIVMGTRGMTALGGLVLGSVATKVLHLAPVPVTLVK